MFIATIVFYWFFFGERLMGPFTSEDVCNQVNERIIKLNPGSEEDVKPCFKIEHITYDQGTEI